MSEKANRLLTVIISAALTATVTFGGDGRIEIAAFMVPYTITHSDSYVVTENLTGVAGFNGITIEASDVTLDLNGFILQGVSGSGSGIYAASNHLQNIVIRNGIIRDWGEHGIDTSAADSSSLREIQAFKNGQTGIRVGYGSSVRESKAYENGDHGIEGGKNCAVIGCTSRTNETHGIVVDDSSLVTDCASFRNDGDGIRGGDSANIIHCASRDNAGYGIRAESGSIVRDCTAYSNDKDGIRITQGGAIVSDCTSYANDDVGVNVETGSLVRSCVTYLNQDEGIKASARCKIIANVCATNGLGIRITGEGSRLEDNHIAGNVTGVVVEASDNVIIRNTAQNMATNYLVTSGNHFQQESNPGTNFPSNPWVNISF